MTSDPVTVYLGLGTNMGNRQANLDRATELLAMRLQIDKVSRVYETDPIGNTEQPRFLNMVCRTITRLAPEGLLLLTQGIELKMGRPRQHAPDTPRPIDIDILFYGDEVVEKDNLVIPHPRIAERSFVLTPLVEIAPNLTHPVSGLTPREMLNGITEKQGVLLWENGQEE